MEFLHATDRPRIRAATLTDTVLSVDLGGTTMRVALVESDGTLVWRSSEPTPHHAHCPDELDRLMVSVLDRHRHHAGRVVIGVPGRVDYRTGRLEHAPNLPQSWVPEFTEERLSALLGMTTHLANDADLATVGESYYGAGAHYRDIVYVTVSTGIGAGVMLDRRLVRGGRSLAEIGHTILNLDGLAEKGPVTAENLGSGTALARQAHGRGLHCDGPDLVALVKAGDATARSVWESVMVAVAATIVNLSHLFSPEVVVIGGGLGRNGALVEGPVRDLLIRRGPKGLPRPIVLAGACLGDDAGLIGGAGWMRALAASS